MPDFTFYRDQYLGETIPEEEFPRWIARAQAKLRRYRRVYTVTPLPDVPHAEENALCAIAEAMYDFAQEDARRGFSSVSVGSVSESYTAPSELCAATLALRERFYRSEAASYLRFFRGAGHV